MNLVIGAIIYCSIEILGFEHYTGGTKMDILILNVPTTIMVVSPDKEYYTVAYDFSKLKDVAVISKNDTTMELLSLKSIKARCEKRE